MVESEEPARSGAGNGAGGALHSARGTKRVILQLTAVVS